MLRTELMVGLHGRVTLCLVCLLLIISYYDIFSMQCLSFSVVYHPREIPILLPLTSTQFYFGVLFFFPSPKTFDLFMF